MTLDQQYKLNNGYKLNNAKLKTVLQRHKLVVGERKISGLFLAFFVWTVGDEHNIKTKGRVR